MLNSRPLDVATMGDDCVGCGMAAGPKMLYEFGPFRVDPDKQLLLRNDKPVPLTPKAFETLLALLRRSREDVPKDELMKVVWPDAFVEEGNLTQNIFLLRKALQDGQDSRRYIVTIPGRGYRFAEQVRTITQDGDDVIIQSHSRSQLFMQQRDIAPVSLTSKDVRGRSRMQSKRSWIAIAVVVLAVSAFLLLKNEVRSAALQQPGLVVIGSFANRSGDPGFEGSLREALRTKLTESPWLNLVSESKARAALKTLSVADWSQLSADAARQVCRVAGGRVLLSGAVTTEVSGQLHVWLEASDCKDGRPIASEEVGDLTRGQVLAALGRAADGLRQRMGEPELFVRQFQTPIAQATTDSLPALKLFSAGEEKRAQGQDYESIPLYMMATSLDPQFALAYARLGIIYNNAQELETSRKFFKKAFELREHANQRERLYITAHYYAGTGESDKLLQVYELWRQLYPRDLVPANNLVTVYLNLGQQEQAVAIAREAVRLGPDNGFPYAMLIRAYQRTGRFAEAKAVYNEAAAKKLDGIVAHLERHIIAFAEGDEAEMQRQRQWADGKPQEGEIVKSEALAAMAKGQMRRAQVLFHHAAEIAMKNDLPQFASTCARSYAEFASEVGLAEQSRRTIEQVLRSEPHSREFLASAALVFANIGDLRRAAELQSRASQAGSADFELQNIVLPTARAVADLRRNDPEAALQELHKVEPYDLSSETELGSIYYRGMAYLKLNRISEADQQFQNVLEHWVSRPQTPYILLSHLRLGRIHALQGNKAAARAEFEKFFATWKDADPDIPLLRQARTEYAKLK